MGAGAQARGPSSVAFPGIWQGAGLQVEQWVLNGCPHGTLVPLAKTLDPAHGAGQVASCSVGVLYWRGSSRPGCCAALKMCWESSSRWPQRSMPPVLATRMEFLAPVSCSVQPLPLQPLGVNQWMEEISLSFSLSLSLSCVTAFQNK